MYKETTKRGKSALLKSWTSQDSKEGQKQTENPAYCEENEEAVHPCTTQEEPQLGSSYIFIYSPIRP